MAKKEENKYEGLSAEEIREFIKYKKEEEQTKKTNEENDSKREKIFSKAKAIMLKFGLPAMKEFLPLLDELSELESDEEDKLFFTSLKADLLKAIKEAEKEFKTK